MFSRHTKELSGVATHRDRRPGTLLKISDLVVLRIINEMTVAALTSGMENKDNGKTEVNSACGRQHEGVPSLVPGSDTRICHEQAGKSPPLTGRSVKGGTGRGVPSDETAWRRLALSAKDFEGRARPRCTTAATTCEASAWNPLETRSYTTCVVPAGWRHQCPEQDSAGMDSKEQYLFHTQHVERRRAPRPE